jgi:hypothetical protein
MNNVFDEMRLAVSLAKDTLRAADNAANDMAILLRGRLRQVNNRDALRKLKRELRDFDMTTGQWKP